MSNFIVIDAFNHVLVGASVALRTIAPDNPKIDDFLYKIIEGMLITLKRKFNGTFYACWDSIGGTQFRKDLLGSYKATRSKSLLAFETIIGFKDFYSQFGIKNIDIPKCEADDTIFALCKILKEENSNNNITIISRDHDLIQVVQEGYANSIYDVVKKQNLEIPDYKIVKYKALVGDKSDNIPGVQGIGKVSALKILEGKQSLSEKQQKEYELMLNVIDAKRNPFLENNTIKIKEILSKN